MPFWNFRLCHFSRTNTFLPIYRQRFYTFVLGLFALLHQILSHQVPSFRILHFTVCCTRPPHYSLSLAACVSRCTPPFSIFSFLISFQRIFSHLSRTDSRAPRRLNLNYFRFLYAVLFFSRRSIDGVPHRFPTAFHFFIFSLYSPELCGAILIQIVINSVHIYASSVTPPRSSAIQILHF